MVEYKTGSEVTESPKRKSLLMILSIVAVLAVVGVGFYFGLQRSALLDYQQRLDQEITTLNTEIASLEAQEIEAAQLAKQWLAVISEDEVRWSTVLSQIDSIIPYDLSARANKVEFLSYSGSAGGNLSLNAKTRPVITEPYDDVAELIEVFNDSSFFTGAYVPSITRGESDEGRKLASFILNVTFKDVTLENLKAGTSVVEEDVPIVIETSSVEEEETSDVVETPEVTEPSIEEESPKVAR